MAKTYMHWDFTVRQPVVSRPPTDLTIDAIQDADLPSIAHLMVDGYRGTIDYEGEDDAAALEELQDALGGSGGAALRPAWLVGRGPDGVPASAIATIRWQGMPLISYVFTAAAQKGRGYAGALVQRAAVALAESGETELALFVTVGNPARSLYDRLGFVETDDPRDAR